jgi:hypothetical protein
VLHLGRHNGAVSAEPLIAFEAALAELSALCTVAMGFTSLQVAAETEFFPQLTALGSRLRASIRAGPLTAEAVERVAMEILALSSAWRGALERLRDSEPYRRAVAALHDDRQHDLAELIPQICAGIHRVVEVPALYFAVSPSTQRRRPGTSPFLGAAECADKILQLLALGMTPDEGGSDWWERDLPFIGCADAAASLESPIALRLDPDDVRVAVFSAMDQSALRIYSRRVRAPFSIVLAGEATDEWWEAYDESYTSFRDRLARELRVRGQPVCIAV